MHRAVVDVEAFRVEVVHDPNGGNHVDGLTLIGSGWHPALFRSEAEALVGPIVPIHSRIVVTRSLDNNAFNRLSNSALIDEVIDNAQSLENMDSKILCEQIAKWSRNHLPDGTFAIRVRTLGSEITGFSRTSIAGDTGSLIANNEHPVDLENPEHEIVVILAGLDDPPNHPDPLGDFGPTIVWGLRNKCWNRVDYSGRQPTDRPFFKPVSLEPRLARLLISLSHRSDFSPTTLVDPFCGTGGIAIEGLISGLNVLASDLDQEMVDGTNSNLSWAVEKFTDGKYKEWDVQNSSVGMTPDVWGKINGALFAFDPPYGRNAWKNDDGLQLLLQAFSAARSIDDKGALCTILPTDPSIFETDQIISDPLVMGQKLSTITDQMIERGWKPVLTSPVKVHRSLARLLIVCHPSH